MERKEALYAISAYTGATRADSWIDVEGGAGTLFAYASMGSNELPSGNVVHEGPAIALGKLGHFAGTHILVPRGGVAVHINAFNFPIWGMLEKFAPSFLAGMPCIVKPATATSYVTEAMVRLCVESGLLPDGALQLVVGSTGDLLDRVDGQDVVTFTGSADTAAKLRARPNLIRHSVPFNAEADSLNCAILSDEVTPDDPEFDLFVKEVAREMTAKSGQKCTAIRRAIVPRKHLDAVVERLKARLAKVVVGDPSLEGVTMGALASHEQQRDVTERVAQLARGNTVLFGADPGFAPRGTGTDQGAFFAPTLLLCEQPGLDCAAHDVEAFGPVSTLMPYDDFDGAIALAERGRGSLVGTLVTRDPHRAAHAVTRLAALHGRLLVLDRDAAPESTGHGSPLPPLKHGGPGRAGGGEELGGLRAVKHYLQRAAIQGTPTMLAAITGEHVKGAAVHESDVHPFRHAFEDLTVGDSLLTHRRTVTDADIVAFGGISGDFFYMHFDEIAAKASPFGKRIAHGYLPRAVGRGRALRLACGGAGARQLRARHPALRQAGGHRRHDPSAPDVQAQDRSPEGRRRRQGAGRRGVGRRGDEPGRRDRGELRHPDARGQAGRRAVTPSGFLGVRGSLTLPRHSCGAIGNAEARSGTPSPVASSASRPACRILFGRSVIPG